MKAIRTLFEILERRKRHMALKKLNQFMKFDLDAFLSGKEIRCNEVGELVDYETKKHLGTKITAVIVKDDTLYNSTDGKRVSNRYEQFNINVLKDVNVPVDAKIMPVDVVKATAYGEQGSPYKSKLSVTCKDIKVMP